MVEVLKAISALLWPSVAIAILCLYHREIRALLRGFRHGKIAGVEFEVAEQVQAVALKTTEAEATVETALPKLLLAPNHESEQPEKFEPDGSWRKDRMYVHAPEYEGEFPVIQVSPVIVERQRIDMASRMQLLDLATKDKALAVLR